MEINSNGFSSKENEFKSLLLSYTIHWKIFLLFILAFTLLAYIFIRYATPEYRVQAKIKILEEKNSSPEMSIYKDLNIFGAGKNKVEDEIEVLNSRSNFIEVVQNLGINIVLKSLGNITSTEIYQSPPIKLNFLGPDSIVGRSKVDFILDLSSDTTFGYSEKQDDPIKVYSFGKNIPTKVGDVIITPLMENFDDYRGQKIKVEILPITDVAQSYKQKVIMTPAQEFSNIVNISLNDPIPQKAIDILNHLIMTYNDNAIADKKAIADRTYRFINDRIADISSNLSTTDQSAEEFKSDRGLTDIASESNIYLTVGAANRQELENATNQLNIAASMKDIVTGQEGFDLVPSNVGLADPSIANTTAKYNELVLERKRLLKSSNEKNPMIVNLDQQLEGLKRNMESSLSSMTNNLSLTVNSLSSQQSQINSRIYSAPKNERALRDITRQQQTTEQLYLYLLQRREESQVAVASTSEQSKIVDLAYRVGNQPISPKKPIIYLAMIIVGFAVPFTYMYVGKLLDNKIHSKIGLEKLVKDIPVLAELPKLTKKDNTFIHNNDRSVLSESLRILRTNLDYIMKSKNTVHKNNIIFITSSIPGEGKTFLSSNLAMTFANTNKKVLLLGADIRNPKLYNFFVSTDVDNMGKGKRNRDIGLTEYLYDDTISVTDLINPMLVQTSTIDVIYSGKIPPNPAELLMNDRIGDLFKETSSKYDYVIVDTAPLMVVTDTLLISKYANHLIYLVRAGFTENKVLEYPVKLKKEGKLNELSFVVNGVKSSNLGYGGKYGYGYGKSVKKWWKF